MLCCENLVGLRVQKVINSVFILQKNAHSYIKAEDPDIFCLQETKCDKEKIPREADIAGYHVYWLSGEKDGYSGTGLYTKVKPINISYGIGEKALTFLADLLLINNF